MNLNPLAVLIYFCSNVVNLRLMKKIRLLSKWRKLAQKAVAFVKMKAEISFWNCLVGPGNDVKKYNFSVEITNYSPFLSGNTWKTIFHRPRKALGAFTPPKTSCFSKYSGKATFLPSFIHFQSFLGKFPCDQNAQQGPNGPWYQP